MDTTANGGGTLPESFASVEEAAEWWDHHSAADDWESTTQVSLQFSAGGEEHLVALESGLAERLAKAAASRGVPLETLANLWLQEKLRAAQ